MILSAAQVCQGSGLERALPYDYKKNAAPHSLLLIDQDGIEHTWTYWIPEEIIPKELETLELMTCVKEEVESIQICPYVGGPIQRVRYKNVIDLWEAYSGRQIAAEIFRGGNPRTCQSNESMFISKLVGTRVEF